jgi:cell division protein FtsA
LVNEKNDTEVNIPVPSISDKPESEVNKPILTHIITCRMDEIFQQIEEEINSSGWASKIRAGIVFTGGGCKLNGLDTYAENKLLMPTRIGSPKNIIGIQNLSGKTRYSTAVGLLLYKDEKLNEMPHRQKSDNPFLKYLEVIWKKFSVYFQREL